jgi:hypothetical protein
MGRAKVKKNRLIALPNIRKLFVNISFTSAILESSPLLCISENTGKSRANIGPIMMKGIPIIER